MQQKLKDLISVSEEQEAIKKLIQKQVLVPFNFNSQIFHGRVNLNGDKFVVKNGFDNAGKTLGHYNNNSIPGLHASDFSIAKKYAERRFIENVNNGVNVKKMEIHKIVPLEKGLFLIDLTKLFDEKEIMPYLENVFQLSEEQIKKVKTNILSQDEKQEVFNLFKVMASKETPQSLMPKLFEGAKNKKILKDLLEICRQNEKQKKPYVLDDDLEKYVLKNSKNEKEENQIRSISGAVNVLQILKETGNVKFLMSKFQSNFDFTENMSLNLKMFKAFLNKNNIVGVKQKLWVSDVIGTKNIDDYFFFNTQKIGTDTMAQKIKKDSQKQQTKEKPFGA